MQIHFLKVFVKKTSSFLSSSVSLHLSLIKRTLGIKKKKNLQSSDCLLKKQNQWKVIMVGACINRLTCQIKRNTEKY